MKFFITLFVLSFFMCKGGEQNKKNKKPKNETTVTKIVSNPFEKNMVFVDGGEFVMGQDSNLNIGGFRKSSDESPIHKVKVSSFYISKFEITKKQWEDIMGTIIKHPEFKMCGECPATYITYEEIMKFLDKINKKFNKHYRLPTEAEWEYATRGGKKSKGYLYSGSDNIDDVAWWDDGKSEYTTHPVGRKKANELGLHDMTGNAFEICSDWYDKEYYEYSPYLNPLGPNKPTGVHVSRGGSFNSRDEYLRNTARYGVSEYGSGFGFRIAHDEI